MYIYQNTFYSYPFEAEQYQKLICPSTDFVFVATNYTGIIHTFILIFFNFRPIKNNLFKSRSFNPKLNSVHQVEEVQT